MPRWAKALEALPDGCGYNMQVRGARSAAIPSAALRTGLAAGAEASRPRGGQACPEDSRRNARHPAGEDAGAASKITILPTLGTRGLESGCTCSWPVYVLNSV